MNMLNPIHVDYSSSEAVEAARRAIRRPWRGSLAPVGFEGVSHQCFRPVWQPREVKVSDYGLLLNPKCGSSLSSSRKDLYEEECSVIADGNVVIVESDRSEANHCPVCLDELVEPITLVGCQHSYCLSCISSWFSHSYSTTNEVKFNAVCPLCKAPAAYFLRFVGGNVKVFTVHNDNIGNQTRNDEREIGALSEDQFKEAASVCWSIKRSSSDR